MEEKTKQCSICNQDKDISEYHIRNKKTGTRRRECKTCRSEYNKQHRLKNIERYKEKDRIYHEKNKESRNEQCRNYREKNYEKVFQKEKEYYNSNREKILEKKKIYHEKNKENPEYTIKRNLRCRLWSYFKDTGKLGSAVTDMGCEMSFLLEWFEFVFLNYELSGVKISWENKGCEWEIDHVIPLSKFTMTNKDHFLISSHWTNLFPLPTKLNRSKYNKICAPSIKKQTYLLTLFLKMKNKDIKLKFLEFFEITNNSTPAGLDQLIEDLNNIKL
jgi:hypothetical protein